MTDPIIEYDFDPRNLPRDYQAAIGLAITASSQTEHTLSTAIAGCAGIDFEYGGAITTHMAMPLKMSVLKSLATIRLNVDDLNLLDDLLAKVELALNKRNALAHGYWCRHPTTGQVYIVKETARTHFETKLEPLSIDELKAEAALIYDAGMDLIRFLLIRNLMPRPPRVRDRASKTPAARKKGRKKT